MTCSYSLGRCPYPARLWHDGDVACEYHRDCGPDDSPSYREAREELIDAAEVRYAKPREERYEGRGW